VSLMSWEPYRDVLALRDSVNRMFEDAFARRGEHPADLTLSAWAVPVDIYETRDEIVVRAELPGIDPKQVKITLIGDQLTISGQREREGKTEGRNFVRVERRYGAFSRSFTLNVPVISDQVAANYRDGVLEIHLPKADEVKPKEIQVKVE
jgi:HSP20 family protein